MIVCKTCRIPFEEGAEFCNSCGGFVDYVGVREGADSGQSQAASGGDPAVGGNATPRADTAQMAIAASAATDSEARAIAEAEAQERERVDALARASTAAAAEEQARARAAAETDTEAKAQAEAEARNQAAAKAKAEAEAEAAAKAADASRRAAAMIAKPAPTPRAPAAPVSPQPGPTAPAEPKPAITTKPTTPPPDLEAGETACAQCGAGNPASRNFCRQCGAPLGQAAPVPVAAAPRNRGALMAKLKLPLVFGVMIGLVAGIYFLTKDDGQEGIVLPDDTVTTEERPDRTTVPEPDEVEEEVTVDATESYVDTGIELEVGAHVVIVATGSAESGGGITGPEGDSNPNFRGANVVDGGHNGLIAKIGPGATRSSSDRGWSSTPRRRGRCSWGSTTPASTTMPGPTRRRSRSPPRRSGVAAGPQPFRLMTPCRSKCMMSLAPRYWPPHSRPAPTRSSTRSLWRSM